MRRIPGMPRWTMVPRAVRARMASSFWTAAAMVVSIAATSPSQPCSLASWSRSARLARIPPAAAAEQGQLGGGGIGHRLNRNDLELECKPSTTPGVTHGYGRIFAALDSRACRRVEGAPNAVSGMSACSAGHAITGTTERRQRTDREIENGT
jgi:hypothetical protein